MKLLFIDLETGGLFPTDPILQMSWILSVDGIERSTNIFIKADPDKCDPIALKVTGINVEKNNKIAISREDALNVLTSELEQFIDVEDRNDKFYLVGYNCHNFDCKFLRVLFVEFYKTYNKYFWSPPTDVMLLAAGFATGQRKNVPIFKLVNVAKSLGIEVDESKLHDSMYDVILTKMIYQILAKEFLS